jgi:hypothetical protein
MEATESDKHSSLKKYGLITSETVFDTVTQQGKILVMPVIYECSLQASVGP